VIKSKSDLPSKPGVYLFKAGEKVLYIGKAKDLKRRVDHYFQKSAQPLIRELLLQAEDIEYIITDDEKDALHLEYNLIHHHSPPFNIRLKDDKSFPLIEISAGNTDAIAFPGVYFTRQIKENHFYIGPLVSARKTRELIDIITRLFKLRTCSASLFKRGSACLYYYIDRCSAPCTGKISAEAYRQQVADAIDFLKGNKKKLLQKLDAQMKRLARELKFEEAQKVKEDMDLLRQFDLESYISSIRQGKMDYDVVALGHDPRHDDCFVILFSILQGRVKRKEFFDFNAIGTGAEEFLKDFLVSFYHRENIPKEILTNLLPADRETLESMFSRLAGRQVTIKAPLKGSKRKMMDLALKNLNLFVNKNKYDLVGEHLKSALQLNYFPAWIEGFDISHFSERERVGAAVVFFRGKAVKKKYRSYIIKKAAAGDTEALKEVLERRFKKQTEKPDLLLIDGGKGQLSAALEIKEKLGFKSDVAAIAKGEERIYLANGDSVVFPEGSPERFLFQNIRDEVHRRAITHHRQRREKI
jgi:excinuclease ABC subunit C